MNKTLREEIRLRVTPPTSGQTLHRMKEIKDQISTRLNIQDLTVKDHTLTGGNTQGNIHNKAVQEVQANIHSKEVQGHIQDNILDKDNIQVRGQDIPIRASFLTKANIRIRGSFRTRDNTRKANIPKVNIPLNIQDKDIIQIVSPSPEARDSTARISILDPAVKDNTRISTQVASIQEASTQVASIQGTRDRTRTDHHLGKINTLVRGSS